MLIKQSGDKIAALAISASPGNASRPGEAHQAIPSNLANEVENIILDDLSFGRIREESISVAHEATFRWILSDSPPQSKPWDNWLRDGGGCY